MEFDHLGGRFGKGPVCPGLSVSRLGDRLLLEPVLRLASAFSRASLRETRG